LKAQRQALRPPQSPARREPTLVREPARPQLRAPLAEQGQARLQLRARPVPKAAAL